MADEFRHITRILTTIADFWTNGDLGQTAITSDANLINYKNSDNTRMYEQVSNRYTTNGSTYTYLDVEFNDVTAQGDLITSSRIERQSESDTRIELNSDQINSIAGGNTSLVVEDDVIYTGVNNFGIGTNVNFSDWPGNYNVIDFEHQNPYSPKLIATSIGDFELGNNYYYDSTDARYEKESTSLYINTVKSFGSNIQIQSGELSGASGTAITFAGDAFNTIVVSSQVGTLINAYSGDYDLTVNSDTGTSIFSEASSGNTIFGNNTSPASLVELWDDDAHPILSITAAHDTDYDPQVQFRTDATDTVKASHGVDGANDAYVIQMGAGGVGGGNDFFINSDADIGLGTSTPATVNGNTLSLQKHLHLFSNSEPARVSCTGTIPVFDLVESGGTANQRHLQISLAYNKSLFRGINDAFTVSSEFLTLDHSNGNVGVNQTTPTEKLHVSGNIGVFAADGDRDNDWVGEFTNSESTNDRSFGVLIQAGSTSSDTSLMAQDHDGANTLFKVAGNGGIFAPNITRRMTHPTNYWSVYFDEDLDEFYVYTPG